MDYLTRGKTAIQDAISNGRIAHLTHASIHKSTSAAIDALPIRAPQYVRTYLRGFRDALLEALWREVEFCYRDAAGTIYSTAKKTARRSTEEFYAAGRGCELGAMECAHLWRDSDRPFTEWAPASSAPAARAA